MMRVRIEYHVTDDPVILILMTGGGGKHDQIQLQTLRPAFHGAAYRSGHYPVAAGREDGHVECHPQTCQCLHREV